MAKMQGAKELRAVLRKLPSDMQGEATKEIKESTQRIHRHARELLDTAASYAPFWHGQISMQDITGQARASYRFSFSQKTMTGRVGLLSGAAKDKAFYLRFFNDGTIHQPARPFHSVASEMERPLFYANQKRALERVFSRLP